MCCRVSFVHLRFGTSRFPLQSNGTSFVHAPVSSKALSCACFKEKQTEISEDS